MDMEYMKRVGRTTFRADVTHNERGDWAISAGAFKATLPMTGPEADAWVEAGKPTDLAELPQRIVAFLDKVAGVKATASKAGPRAIRYDRERFAPLDGEERVTVQGLEYRPLPFDHPNRVTTGRVRCTSPRCEQTREKGWLVVQLPGSRFDNPDRQFDEETRVEGITPAEFAEQHRAWHRETNPPTASARKRLDEWIDRHRNTSFPELSEDERREIDLGLAIAKSER
jgi:hypothetical protein